MIDVDYLYSISHDSRKPGGASQMSDVRAYRNKSHMIEAISDIINFRDDGCPELKSPVF
jgi:hypothetical protein